jgi:hypothetical protein
MPVRTFYTSFKGARSAPGAVWCVIPREVRLAGEVTVGALGGGGRKRPRAPHVTGLAASAFAPAAHGGRPPVRYPGHCPSPTGRRTPTGRARAGTATLPALQS